MKKTAKISAILLVIITAALIAASLADIAAVYNSGVYRFEESFSESQEVSERLMAAAYVIDEAMYKAARGTVPTSYDYSAISEDIEFYAVDNNTGAVMINCSISDPTYYQDESGKFDFAAAKITRYSMDIVTSGNEYIERLSPYYERAKTVYDTDTLLYLYDGDAFVTKDEYYTQYGREIPEDVVLYYIDENGDWRVYEPVTETVQTDYTAYIHINPEALTQLEISWNNGKAMFDNSLRSILICTALLLAALVYLTFTAGQTRTGFRMMAIDSVWTEVSLIAAFIIAAAVVLVDAETVYQTSTAEYGTHDGLRSLIPFVTGIGAAALVGIYMSLIRNIKNGTFWKNCICVKCVGALWRICKKAARGVKKFLNAQTSTKIICAGVFIYSIILAVFAAIFGIEADVSGGVAFIMFIICAALALAAVYITYKALSDICKIREGLKIIKSGNTAYVIPECHGIAAGIEKDINTIGEGLERAIETSVKSERMKSELITNVSHDLKTPLTSIINYAELLSGETLTPPEANDYVKAILQKSNKLKQLTADLFDISKAQSGNEEVNLECIDLKLLLTQSMAELEGEIKRSGLDFRVKLPDEDIFISADGKKLSRVFENLISNATKYAMAGTRVYVSVECRDGVSVTEFKNISAYPIEFTEEEITERFVRGDKSRTDGGNGLGLAIAKSYTELMGGKFSVKTDGDLFKAAVILRIY